MLEISNMMKNCIIEWVGDILIRIPFIKNQHELNLMESEITTTIFRIKKYLILVYMFGYSNRLMDIHENLDDLHYIKLNDNYPSSE